MSMALKRETQHTAVADVYNRVEAIADGAVVADGILLDLRGARSGASLYHRNAESVYGHKYVLVNRDPDDGSWSCVVSTTHTTSVSGSTRTISTYPNAIIGSTGQTITSTLQGSITQTDGLRAAFRTAHDELNAWGDGLDALSRYYKQSIVNAGHDWLYWAGHIAAYIVAHSNSYTWAQKMTWAETVITGAADVASPAQFYANTSAHTAPTRPKTWVNPANGNKVNLGSAINLATAAAPSIAQLDNGGWIDTLTA